MDTPLKTCRKCLKEFPATLEFFYKNSGGKFGVTPRCKACVNQDNAASHAKRLAANPEKIRAQAAARSKKHYHNNLEKSRERQCAAQKRARNDPIRGERIKARKRANGAGLTPEEIQKLLDMQGGVCAICGDPPTDLDHCHKTGKVRFLLCKHCNRGLGAFKDNPNLMRKAAKLLEDFNDN